MTEIDQLIELAFKSGGKQEDVNKVYLTLLRTIFFIPVKKEISTHDEEPFVPLFAKIEEKIFMLAFDTIERLADWAGDHVNELKMAELSGRDLIAGIGETVFLVINPGTTFHKEFSPEEVKRLKMIVARIDQLREQNS